MNVFKSKHALIAGTDYREVTKNARKEYARAQKLTKRQPYVRSRYFNRDKVFINIFWNHLSQKRGSEQMVRARLLLAAFDLLRHTTKEPEIILGNSGIILYRFYGVTSDGVYFCTQVRQARRTGRKDFMSVFPKKLSQ